jgi:hypothetical protein
MTLHVGCCGFRRLTRLWTQTGREVWCGRKNRALELTSYDWAHVTDGLLPYLVIQTVFTQPMFDTHSIHGNLGAAVHTLLWVVTRPGPHGRRKRGSAVFSNVVHEKVL